MRSPAPDCDSGSRYAQAMELSTSVRLGDHYAHFVAEEVASGRYHTASEVVRAAPRLPEGHKSKMHDLRSALVAGEESGEPGLVGVDDFVAGNRERARCPYPSNVTSRW